MPIDYNAPFKSSMYGIGGVQRPKSAVETIREKQEEKPEYVQKSPLVLLTGAGSTRTGRIVPQNAPETQEAVSKPVVTETGTRTQQAQQQKSYSQVQRELAQAQYGQKQVVVAYYPEFKDQELNRSLSGFTKRSGGTIEISKKTEFIGERFPRERTTISARSSSSEYLMSRGAEAEQFNLTGWTAAELLSGEKFVTAPKLISFDTSGNYPAEAVFKSETAIKLREQNYFNKLIMGESLRGGLGATKPSPEMKSSKFFDYLRFAGRELTQPRTIETPFDKKAKEPVPFFTTTPTRTTRTDIKADTSLPTLYRTGALSQRTLEPKLFSLQVEREPNVFQKFTRYTEKLNTQDTDTRTLERIGVNFARIPLGVANIVYVAPAKLVYSIGTDVLRGENKTIKGFVNFGKDVASGRAGYKFGEKLRTDSGFAAGEVLGVLFAPKILGANVVVGKNVAGSAWFTRGKSIYAGRYKTLGSYFRTTRASYKNIFIRKGIEGKNVLSEGVYIKAGKVFRYGESGRLSTAGSLAESIAAFGSSKMILVSPFERVRTIGRALSDSPASTPKLWMQVSKSSEARGAYAWTDLYEAYVSRVKGYEYESGLRVQTSSPARITGSRVTLEGKALAGLEDAGLYVSPVGKGMAYFLRISTEKTSYGLNPAGFFSNLFSSPRVSIFKVRGISQYPRDVISSRGFEAVNAFQKSMAEGGIAYITKRSELGFGNIPRQSYFNPVTKTWMRERGTREIEATIPLDAKFALERAKSYTIVKGRVVGIQKGRVLYDRTASASELGITIKNPLEDFYKKDVFISTEGRGIRPEFSGKNLVSGESYMTGLEIAKQQSRGISGLATPRPVYEFAGSFKRDSYGVVYAETPSRTESPSLLTTYRGEFPSRVGRPSGYSVSASIAPYDFSSVSYSFERSLAIPDVERRGGRGESSSVATLPSYSSTGYAPSGITSSGYFPPPKSSVGLPPLIYFPPIWAAEQKYKSKKRKVKEKTKIRSERTGVFVLPDLQAVFQTEAFNYAKFGKGEAVAPRVTKGIYRSALIAFKGYGVGYIPTEQMRTGRIRL